MADSVINSEEWKVVKVRRGRGGKILTPRETWRRNMHDKGFMDMKEACEFMDATRSTVRKFIDAYDVHIERNYNMIMIDNDDFKKKLLERNKDKYVHVTNGRDTERANFRRESRQRAIDNEIPADEWTLMPAAARQLNIDYRAVLNMVKNGRIQSRGFGFDDRRVRIEDIVDYINDVNLHVKFGRPAFKSFKDGGERFIANGGNPDAIIASKKDKRREGLI